MLPVARLAGRFRASGPLMKGVVEPAETALVAVFVIDRRLLEVVVSVPLVSVSVPLRLVAWESVTPALLLMVSAAVGAAGKPFPVTCAEVPLYSYDVPLPKFRFKVWIFPGGGVGNGGPTLIPSTLPILSVAVGVLVNVPLPESTFAPQFI